MHWSDRSTWGPHARRWSAAVAAAVLLAVALVGTGSTSASSPAPTETESAAPLAWPERRLSPCGAFDPVRHRLLVFGGREEGATGHHGDVWALELRTRRPQWRLLVPEGAPGGPPSVRGCGAAYDPNARRLIVFGGTGDGGASTNGVWALALDGRPTWTQLCDAASCGTPPTPRRSAPASFDPIRNRLVVFGGLGASYTSDLWYLDLTAAPQWERVSPAGAAPGIRAGHSQLYDAARDTVWLFGGTRPGGDWNDLWRLDLSTSTWHPVLADGCADPCPSRRSGASLVHDTDNDQLVLWGGLQGDGSFAHDVRALQDLDGAPAWTALTPDSAGPQPRFFHLAAYDPAGEQMLVFGGGLGASAFKDTITLLLPDDGSAPAWRGVAPAVPVTPRDQVALHLDPGTGQLYAFGGFGAGTFPGARDAGVHLAETRRLDLDRLDWNGRWRDATSSDPREVPLSREAVASASDVEGHRWFFVGGLSGDDPQRDVWMADVRGAIVRWRQLCSPTSCGTAPAARWGAHAVYDPVDDRVVVFGGMDGAGATFADTWVLELGGAEPVWRPLDVEGITPAARWGGVVAYDPHHHRMVLVGGQSGPDAVATSFGDTWALALDGAPAWTLLTSAGPSPRRSPAAAVTRDAELFVTGGYTASTGAHHNDVWRLDLAEAAPTWEQRAPDACGATDHPQCRRSHSAAHDPATDRLVVVFGRDASQFFGDVWTFSDQNGWRPATS